MKDDGGYSVTVARSDGTRILINTLGPFDDPTHFTVPVGADRDALVDFNETFGSELDVPQYQDLWILHELGHVTGAFQDDTNNKTLSETYTRQVLEKCFGQKK